MDDRGRLDPVHDGHPDIHQNDVRPLFVTDPDHLRTVGRGRDDGEVRLGPEQAGATVTSTSYVSTWERRLTDGAGRRSSGCESPRASLAQKLGGFLSLRCGQARRWLPRK